MSDDPMVTVMQIVRQQCRTGCPVAAHDVVDLGWTRGRLSSAQSRSALSALLKQGHLTRPTRGFYLPVETDDA